MPPTLPNTLTNGTTADATQVMADLNAINAAVDQATVTSLPGSPYDGQAIYYLADATNGVVWHLKYRSASGSAYKWELVGGEYLYGIVETEEGAALNTYGDVATPGPSITAPLAGDYMVEWGGVCYPASGGLSQVMAMGIRVNATDPASANLGLARVAATRENVASIWDTLARFERFTGLAASDVLKVRYFGNQAGSNSTFAGRRLRLRPVRVG